MRDARLPLRLAPVVVALLLSTHGHAAAAPFPEASPDSPRAIGFGGSALILGDQEHEQMALEEGTRFVSFKRSTGTQPIGE